MICVRVVIGVVFFLRNVKKICVSQSCWGTIKILELLSIIKSSGFLEVRIVGFVRETIRGSLILAFMYVITVS